MSKENCGCEDSPETTYGEHILVKASSNTASTCGTPETIGGSSPTCDKQDQTFDRLSSDFAFPSDQSVPVLVCNGSLYSVGQWIHFVNSKATVQILSINANELTVRAVCSNGAEVDGNPTAGTIIRAGDPIVAVRSPLCLTDAQKKERITDDLASLEEVGLPLLQEESGAQAEIQPVGWVQSNPGNANFKKSLKRILGVLFKNGKPILSSLNTIGIAQAADHRQIVIDKNSKEVKQRLNLSEETSLEANKKYIPGVVNGSESLIPGFIFVPVFKEIDSHGGTFEDRNSWVQATPASPYVNTISLSVQEVNDVSILTDTFYAQLHFLFGLRNPSAFNAQAIIKVDDVVIGGGFTYFNVDHQAGFSVIVPVDTSSKNVEVKVEIIGASGGNARIHLTTQLKGIYA